MHPYGICERITFEKPNAGKIRKVKENRGETKADEYINNRTDDLISGSAKRYRYQRGAAIPPLNRAVCLESDVIGIVRNLVRFRLT